MTESLGVAWKAQKRLNTRFKSITSRRKSTNYVILALARELCGFVWAVGQHVTRTPAAAT